jgi:predicted metalloprotease
MRWTPGGVSDDIEDRRDDGGGGGGFNFGGGTGLGIGGTIGLIVLSLIFRRDLVTSYFGHSGGPPAVHATRPENPARKASEQRDVQFVSFVLDDVQATWTKVLPRYGVNYRHAKLVLFHDVVQSGCGTAESATGPFYCPADQKVYIDLGFFRELKERFGAPGDFAQAYVIAHEIGHHVQNLLGIETKVSRLRHQEPAESNVLSVRLELQADCFAGVWGHSTEQRKIIDEADVQQGLHAAAAIGDDRLQRMATGRVMPDKFTHGTSAQRVAWFKRGLETGDVKACDTFVRKRE